MPEKNGKPTVAKGRSTKAIRVASAKELGNALGTEAVYQAITNRTMLRVIVVMAVALFLFVFVFLLYSLTFKNKYLSLDHRGEMYEVFTTSQLRDARQNRTAVASLVNEAMPRLMYLPADGTWQRHLESATACYMTSRGAVGWLETLRSANYINLVSQRNTGIILRGFDQTRFIGPNPNNRSQDWVQFYGEIIFDVEGQSEPIIQRAVFDVYVRPVPPFSVDCNTVVASREIAYQIERISMGPIN